MVTHVFNPNAGEAEADGSLLVGDQPGLYRHSKFRTARAIQRTLVLKKKMRCGMNALWRLERKEARREC